jgi:molybdopterin-guanine dinucleotide biosynthesis protein A
MGRDKALLPFGPEEVLLQRVVRLVGEAIPFGQVVCVAAADQSLPRLPHVVEVVRDAEPHLGPLAGLAAGMAAIQRRADAVFVCGCDAPLLTPGFVTRMCELLAEHQIAAPHDGERFHPLAAVYRTVLLPIAESMLAAGDRSLGSLLARCDTRSVPVDELRDVDPSLASLDNCNTPTDFQRALAAAFPRSVEP